MNLTSYATVQEFYAKAAPFLLGREADHNLLLGLSADLRHDPHTWGPEDPYLVTVEDGGLVVAAAIRTPPFGLTVSHANQAPLQAIAADAARRYDSLPSVTGPGDTAQLFADAWREQTGQEGELTRRMRIYQIMKVRPPTGVPGRVRRAAPADRDLLRGWFAGFHADTDQPLPPERVDAALNRWLGHDTRTLYIWEDDGPAAMTGVAGPTPNGIRISAVYTPPERRRHGYASALVAAASQEQLDSGRSFCFLYTDLANPTANHIYQAIGYEPVCDVNEYEFTPRD